jgi:alpha-N-acetylglucosaminidase
MVMIMCRASDKFLGVIDDMEALAASQPNFLLGEWIQAARSWGSSAAESVPTPSSMLAGAASSVSLVTAILSHQAAFEFSARTQVTLWAPAVPANNLHDYAYKLWSGLIGGTLPLHMCVRTHTTRRALTKLSTP